MSTLSKVAIDIVTQYKGANEIKKAQNSFNGLDSAVSKLGKTLAITFSASAIAAFGKSAFDAFSADQKAAAVLAQTLKNVGQGFADSHIEQFITNTSLATGILKNDLRSAFDSLVRQTHNASTAQDLLNTAINVSAGSGKDLSTVSASLAKAYGGQTQAIGRLNVGLTKADLTGKSFAQIQAKLNALFAGQAGIAADTYAGKIKRLGASFEEAKVIIGKGMVDAFTSLSTSSSFDSFVTKMQDTATNIADIIRGIGIIAADASAPIKKNSWLATLADALIHGIPGISQIQLLANLGKQSRVSADNLAAQAASSISTRGAGRTANETMAQQIADQKAAAAALLKTNAEKTKQLKLDTAIAMLKKSMAVFDQQKIQIAAALANSKLTADEKARLQLMQTQADLQQAIDDKNTTVLDGLMSKIKGLQDSLTTLQKTSIGNPFAEAIQGATDAATAFGLTTQAYQNFRTGERGNGIPNANSIPATSIPGGGAQPMQPVTVNLMLDGQQIQQVVVDNTASGSPSSYSRNLGAPLRDSW
jgi:hypothetical protein